MVKQINFKGKFRDFEQFMQELGKMCNGNKKVKIIEIMGV